MISLRTFPLRSAAYHWQSNLPVLLGVAIGAAVLTGALIIGDSLRGSLHDRALRQLNGVESAYLGTRLVREEIAKQLPGDVVPVLILQGSIRSETSAGESKYLGRVTVIGVNDVGIAAFKLRPQVGEDSQPIVTLSATVAERLGVKRGDKVELGVERFTNVPRSSLLGKRSIDDVTASLRVEVTTILPADHPANDFNLSPNPAAPLNVFVPLKYLQTRLEKPGRINALLARSGTTPELNESLAKKLALDDWSIRVNVAPKRGEYLSVESEQLILDPAVVIPIEAAARELNARSERTFTYMVNAISTGTEPIWNKDVGTGKQLVPYSVIAAINPAAAPPLGPFLPTGVTGLADDEIVLSDWTQSTFTGLKPGDLITLTYFKPEMEAVVEETSATFRFKGYLPLAGAAADPDLTPPFPGITDKLKIGDWESPFELNSRRVQKRDEEFWDKHRTTPKAYITQAKGEQLFASRFGTVTSIRVAPPAGMSLKELETQFRTKLLGQLKPETAGLQFQPTKQRLLEASKGGTDFGMLFLLFSNLLIFAALLLVGLLFRLAIERRAKEVGLLLATGYSTQKVMRLLLVEGIAVAVLGTLLGLALAIGYAELMLKVLTVLWPDVEVGKFLKFHVTPLSLTIEFFLTIGVAILTIWFSLRGLMRVSAPALLRSETTVAEDAVATARRPFWSVVVGVIAIVLGGVALATGPLQSKPDERSMAFFGGGFCLLVGGLFLARAQLLRPQHATIRSRGRGALLALGLRNAGRKVTRTLLTATLIALAVFLVVSVESFRRKPDDAFLQVNGGSGGFRLIAEADVPIFQPFDREPGRDDFYERLRAVYQQQEARNPSGLNREQLLTEAKADLDGIQAFGFRLKGGDDASCLNLFQAGQPRILGVPNDLIGRGGFLFTQTEATTDNERSNPWLLLKKPVPTLPNGIMPIPVIVEQNTAMFMLKTMLGGIVEIPDANGTLVPVRIVAFLQDSVFQSELLMADMSFRKLFPRQEGYQVFLIDAPAGKEAAIAQRLETGLRANGLIVTSSTAKVATYQAVVGAYLTTFQLLGGFGLLLAILGLGVVVLRGVWERTGELALLRAVGYRTSALQLLILSETLVVLAIGLVVGAGAAIASVLPNLALGGSLPWTNFLILLVAVVTAGVVVAGLATVSVAQAPLIPALRKD